MDPEVASAAELAAAYAERWEFESSLDEIKTHQRGRGGVLRSKLPEMIEQEIWALLLTHYAIRHLMCEAADQADIDPDRLSFMRSLRVIRRQVSDQAGFSPSAPDCGLESGSGFSPTGSRRRMPVRPYPGAALSLERHEHFRE
jgi:hypothetical protein